MHDPINRRAVLKSLAAMTAALLVPGTIGADTPATALAPVRDRLGELLPQRKLGRTGAMVTMLGVGGWHLIAKQDEAEARKTVETALAGGVRFFDTAVEYENGRSEERLGRLLVPKYRDAVFLMTKTNATTAAAARKQLDDSLRRLGTDHLDLWQIHHIDSPEDADQRTANGVMDVLIDAQAKGKTRFIGFTGHRGPAGHLRMLEHCKEKGDALQTVQMPINVADPSYNSFILKVLPVLVDRGYGALAMKTLANGGFFGGSRHGEHGPNPKVVPDRLSIADAIHFVWSLPVSVLISGANNAAMLQEKIDLARSFAVMSDARRADLISKIADMAGRTVEFYKA
jgi:uncharacterized protein